MNFVKVRAHNVLKQQKESKDAEQEASVFDEERWELFVDMLALKHHINVAKPKLWLLWKLSINSSHSLHHFNAHWVDIQRKQVSVREKV